MLHHRMTLSALFACLLVPVSSVTGCSSASGPDASHYEILYVIDSSGTAGSELHAVRPDGTSDHVLATLPGRAYGLSVASDGTIAASAQTGQYTANLFLLPAEGGTPTPVLTISNPEALWPSWSPDGSRLVFGMGSGGWPQIQMVDRDGGNLHLVTDGSDGCSYYMPSWSPDGAWVASARDCGFGHELVLMRTDGTGTQALASGMEEGVPAWSPDGSRIAFSATADATSLNDIFVVARDGTDLRRLTTSDSVDTTPAWSPDGSKIAFVSTRAGTEDIWVMNADGTGMTQVTSGSGDEAWPAWRIAP
jgi:Tol biopolymer transport system component